ncbi:hypothetical protein EON80_29735, partial [bacterium]
VEIRSPFLGWQIESGVRNWMQSAYQIQVASSSALLKSGKADLWDSGKVASSQSVNIPYAGKALASSQGCFWRVRVWDRHAVPSPFSSIQSWTMGLFESNDWKGQWIAGQISRDTETEGLILPSPHYLRKSFDLKKKLKRALLFTTARGTYEMRLNGAQVGESTMAPSWTDYDKRIEYHGYDVSSRLRPGTNVLGAILGDGWYSGFIGGRDLGHRNFYGKQIAFKGQLMLEFTDGTKQVIGSDESWKGGTGPIVYSDMLMGELYDARKGQPNWDTAAFDGSSWKAVTAIPEVLDPFFDVTDKLRAAVKDNALAVTVDNKIAGDPSLNTAKQLRVTYTVAGRETTQTLNENQLLQIPAPADGAGALVIRRAVYGNLDGPRKLPVRLVNDRGVVMKVTQ